MWLRHGCLCDTVGINDELLAPPDTARDPKATVDNLGVPLVGRLDGEEHAEAVLAAVNLLGLAAAQQGVEDVAGAGEGATGAHLHSGGRLVYESRLREREKTEE